MLTLYLLPNLLAYRAILPGIVFLFFAVVSQELARPITGRPLPQKYSALSGLIGMLLAFGVEIVATFIASAIIARWIAYAWNGRKLSIELTLLAGMGGLSLAAFLAEFSSVAFAAG
jgi:hypothetical protein